MCDCPSSDDRSPFAGPRHGDTQCVEEGSVGVCCPEIEESRSEAPQSAAPFAIKTGG